MIKKIRNKIMLVALIASASIALAQPDIPEIPQPQPENHKGVALPMILRCFDYPADEGLKNGFGELPFVEGDGDIEFTNSKGSVPIKMKLYVNPDTHSWTTVFILSPTLNCVAAGGADSFGPANIAEEGIRM